MENEKQLFDPDMKIIDKHFNKRLIDANALMKYINEKHSYSGLPMAAHICTMELLTYAPTVDAVEVVHGRWIELHSMAPEYKCSECGQSYEWWEVSEAHYCPNCGAKMDGERKDNA